MVLPAGFNPPPRWGVTRMDSISVYNSIAKPINIDTKMGYEEGDFRALIIALLSDTY